MNWEIIIGLETHVQLSCVSKIFSGASTRFNAPPNTQACAVDLALPGALPVMNRGAVERALRLGLAIGATIAPRSIFARKHYFYPDLPKGYQISQHETPIIQQGALTVSIPASQTTEREAYQKTVRITRAHLEEDAGKSLHEDFAGMTGIDLNRAGTPLLEIVAEPDLRSAAEAVAYAKALHALVIWLDICDGNMQEGSFRCDANVSVRPFGQPALGTRCEIKNLNSFRFLEEAIQAESCRQIELIEAGGMVRQETRLYDPAQRTTRAMRRKEDAEDYRYFPDPDLMPLVIDTHWIDRVRDTLPELPAAMQARFIAQYGLAQEEAHLLTASKALAAYFESVIEETDALVKGKVADKSTDRSVDNYASKAAANWICGMLASQLNRDGISIAECPVTSAQLALLLVRIADGTLSNRNAKEVFCTIWEERTQDAQAADRIIEQRGLKQISDADALDAVIDEALTAAANAKSIEEFHAGNKKALNALVGQIMKATHGKANPQQVNELLKKKLSR